MLRKGNMRKKKKKSKGGCHMNWLIIDPRLWEWRSTGRRYWKMNFSCHYERRKERITYLPIYFFLSQRSLWSYRWRSIMEVIRETDHITIKSFKICPNRTNTPPWISIKVWEAIASNNWFINLLDLIIFFHTSPSDGLNPQCVLLGFTVFP